MGQHTFRLPGLPGSFERDVIAACLDTGGSASHRTAARLHDLHRDLHGDAVEVVVTRRLHRAEAPDRIVHSTTNLPPDDLVRIGPIPCVGVARTFLMLAALVPEVPQEAVRTGIGDAVREGTVSDAWLWWRLEVLRCRGRAGVTVMEEILRRRQKLGPPRAGWSTPSSTCSTPPACAAARPTAGRRRQLVLAGKRVMVFTDDEVVGDPARVVADVAAALAEIRAA